MVIKLNNIKTDCRKAHLLILLIKTLITLWANLTENDFFNFIRGNALQVAFL